MAASASSRASPRAFTSLRCVCFSSCARSSRSFTASMARAASFSCFSIVCANCCSSSFRRVRCRAGPFGLQGPFFFGEFLRGARGFALQRFQFVAAAVQVGDQRGGFVRFGRKLRAGAVDHLRGQAQAARDVDAARSAGHADHQAIRRAQIYFVEFDGGVEDARRGRGVRFQAVVVRGRERQAAALAEFIEQGDGERRAFFGSRARAEFIDEHERARRGGFEHGAHVEHVRGKCGEIGGDRLLVADVHKHAIDERQARRLRSHGNAGLRGEHGEAHRLERDGFAARVRAR